MSIHAQFDNAVHCLEEGLVENLHQLLKQFPDLAQSKDEDNATLLIRLIDWPGYKPSSAETAKALVDSGVDIESRRDQENGTALAGAICTLETDVIKVLLDAGADIHAPLGWMEGTCLDLAERHCEDLGRQRDEKTIAMAEMFSAAAGFQIPRKAPFGGTIPLLFVKDVDDGLSFLHKQTWIPCELDSPRTRLRSIYKYFTRWNRVPFDGVYVRRQTTYRKALGASRM